MANSFIFLADLKTGTSLQVLCSPSRSLSTLAIISLLFSISKFLGKMTCSRGLAVFNILKAFSAAASKLETIRQVDAKKQNAPSETKPLIVHKLSHHFSLGIEFEVFKEDVFVENRKQHLMHVHI
uniref:Uncharacterized protein n=1 Tax=Brassica oleracea TaxID=3712 RepID=A0A3P6B3S2_BRAOL|nr:unnamed protein product [Brassica oleracea]